MIITRYKPLFSVSVSCQQPDLTLSSAGLVLETLPISLTQMTDLSLAPMDKGNMATVYYEGLQMPINAPLTSEPYNEIDSNQFFYFGVSFIEKGKIPALKFHSTAAIAKSIGFPLLYDAKVNSPDGSAVFTMREDVKVGTPIFTFVANAAATGVAGNWATIEIKDENNNTVPIPNNTAPLNDKQIDGVNAIPEFAFSIDMSLQPTGIYKFKVGNFEQSVFIPNNIVISNQTLIIRVLKNNNLIYHKTLADTSFTQFNLTISKA